MGVHDRHEDSEADSGLTPEQAELLSKLEELYRELPSARQRVMIKQLRAKREQPATEKTPE
jgi:hypothetical protein